VSCPRHGIERCPRGSQDKPPKSRVGGEYGQLHLSYTGLIDGKAGAYGVVFPNLPGRVAIGATIDEAVRNAADAMRDWADVTVETSGAMPEPRPSEMLLTDPEIADEIGAAQERTAGAIVGPAGQGLSVDRCRHTRGDRRGSELAF
jgi:predicted RNase H-like HicB family nuclease